MELQKFRLELQRMQFVRIDGLMGRDPEEGIIKKCPELVGRYTVTQTYEETTHVVVIFVGDGEVWIRSGFIRIPHEWGFEGGSGAYPEFPSDIRDFFRRVANPDYAPVFEVLGCS